jgi:hypothetical protein
MTPEESSIFFTLLSGTASEPVRRSIDFLADPDAGDWDQGIMNTYLVGDYICGDLQEHARGCNLPIAECQLCRLCELEIKRMWPDLWLSKWPGAKAADETREFTAPGKCPEPECGSTDRGTRYQITPPTEGNPLGTYCKNAWHHVPEVQRDDEFTALEFQVIFGMCWSGMCWRLNKEEIAEQLGVTEGIVHTIMRSIFEKADLMGRGDLFGFVRDALNNELRRRSGR